MGKNLLIVVAKKVSARHKPEAQTLNGRVQNGPPLCQSPERAETKRGLGKKLEERGFDEIKQGHNRDRFWLGIGLLEIDADTADTVA